MFAGGPKIIVTPLALCWLLGSDDDAVRLTVLLPMTACCFLFVVASVVVSVVICRHCYTTKSMSRVVDDVTDTHVVCACCRECPRIVWQIARR